MTGFVVFVLLIVIYLGVGYYLTTRLIYPHTKSHEETYRLEVDSGRLNPQAWQALPREEVKIKSPFGYDIYGIYIPNGNAHKTVILAHGITYTLLGSIKYLPLFYRRGFNIFLYDHRFHGRTGGKNCTFGYYEKYDLKKVVDWVYERMGGAGTVGLHGESLGAAVVLQEASIDDRVAFVIADCPYSDLTELLKFRITQDFHLPPAIFLPVADFITTQLTGMSFSTVSPIRDVRTMTTPVMFIHGKNDTYIPPQMSQSMYTAKTIGIRAIHLMENARHAESFDINQSEYNQVVGQFLTHLGMD
jgi:uncharacterized protein